MGRMPGVLGEACIDFGHLLVFPSFEGVNMIKSTKFICVGAAKLAIKEDYTVSANIMWGRCQVCWMKPALNLYIC